MNKDFASIESNKSNKKTPVVPEENVHKDLRGDDCAH